VALRASKKPIRVIDNYDPRKRKEDSDDDKFVDEESDQDDETHGLLIERGTHYCNLNNTFEKNFRIMYENTDPRLFDNDHLLFRMYDESDSNDKLCKFVE